MKYQFLIYDIQKMCSYVSAPSTPTGRIGSTKWSEVKWSVGAHVCMWSELFTTQKPEIMNYFEITITSKWTELRKTGHVWLWSNIGGEWVQ